MHSLLVVVMHTDRRHGIGCNHEQRSRDVQAQAEHPCSAGEILLCSLCMEGKSWEVPCRILLQHLSKEAIMSGLSSVSRQLPETLWAFCSSGAFPESNIDSQGLQFALDFSLQ